MSKQTKPKTKKAKPIPASLVWFEIPADDVGRAKSFYNKLFGWKIKNMPEINYRIVETGGEGGINGGILKPDREGPWPAQLLFYILVDELAPYRKKIQAAGGKIHVEEQEVPGMGWLSLFTDPEGRMMGLWKAKETS